MLLNPMPTMRHQKDLNCGYYCEHALLAYWFARVNNAQHQHLKLKKNTLLGYDPKTSPQNPVVKINITKGIKPTNAANWKALLQTVGPVIVSGKLGGADWGTWRLNTPLGDLKWKAGCGHYVLIVGASRNHDTLSYKDPLQGDAVKTGDFTYLDNRIGNDIYYVKNARDATAIFVALGST